MTDTDDRSLGELKADHIAEHPDGCRNKSGCVWCAERTDPHTFPTLFDDGGDAA